MRREIKLVRGDQEKGTVLMEENGTVMVCLEDREERVCQLAEVPGEATLNTVLEYWRSFGFNLREVEHGGETAISAPGPGEGAGDAPDTGTSPVRNSEPEEDASV